MIARIAVAALGSAVLGAAVAPGQPALAKPRPAAAPAPTSSKFVHARGLDMFGYYMPTSETRVGRFKLENISLGSPADFAKWERGQRSRTYAPVMVVVSDLKSPKRTNELGQEFHTVQIRVLPESYRVEPGYFEFTGHDARLGRVVISGAFDAKALARARRAGPNGGQATVITGGMEFAGERIRNISFFWFAGD